MYTRSALSALLVIVPVVATARTLSGQIPTSQMGTPSMPVTVLPIEVVSAKPSTLTGRTTYERAGLKPREYRIGSSPDVTGAIWMTFTEGSTTRTVNGRTVTTGTISRTGAVGQVCGDRMAWNKSWLQFRTADLTGRVIVSNVKGDSTCAFLD